MGDGERLTEIVSETSNKNINTYIIIMIKNDKEVPQTSLVALQALSFEVDFISETLKCFNSVFFK